MNKNNASRHKLKEILAHQKYEDLEPYQQTASWRTLNHEDKHSLAALFVVRGEKQLAQSDPNGVESFRIAARITPKDPQLFYRMGCIYASHSMHFAFLKLAEEAFSKVIDLTDGHFNARLHLGEIYTCLGNTEEEDAYFEKAEFYFQGAFNDFHENDDLAQLYWQWGLLGYHWGKKSGETSDYMNALEKFRRAASLGMQTQNFWTSYGRLFMELAPLLNKPDLYIEAAECCRQGVREAFDSYEGWFALAESYHRIFENSFSEDSFDQAEDCYKMASQLNEPSSTLYLNWGTLLHQGGKFFRDLELIHDSLSKFEKAHSLDPDQTTISFQWAQALMLYGAQTENLNKIQEARQKIFLTLKKEPDSIECWNHYGLCMIELGKYFHDEYYFREAIDQFNQGLTLNGKKNPHIHYGRAIAHFCIGDLKDDMKYLEKAAALFSTANDLFVRPSRQFWNDWGVALMRMAEISNDKNHVFAALEKFDKALEDNISDNLDKGIDPEWLYNYGCAWDFLGDFQEDPDCYEHAIASLTKVLEIDPTFSHARYNLALAYAHYGELCLDIESFHKSIEQFQNILAQDSEDEMGWNDYGITLMHLSQIIHEKTFSEHSMALYELAESKLLQAAALGNTQSYYNLACLYSLMNKHSYAMHFLEKADDSNVLPTLQEMLEDEWLEGLRATQAFRNFVANLPPSKRQESTEF